MNVTTIITKQASAPRQGLWLRRWPVKSTELAGLLLLAVLPGELAAQPFITQQAYVKPSAVVEWQWFGNATAISQDTMVVGAPGENNRAGAAYVFVRNGTAWIQQARLEASNADPDDLFGASVAISSNTIVVAAVLEDSNATGINGDQADNSSLDSGAAYVFVRNGETWTQTAYLKASNSQGPSGGQSDLFGGSVAIDGNTIVVGAWGEDSGATGINGNQNDNSVSSAGAVYVFVRNNGAWTQQAYVKASRMAIEDGLGQRVRISGDTIAAGLTDGAFAAAYVFVRNGTTWSQQAFLRASVETDPAALALSGNTLVLGGFRNFDNSGVVYVYVRNATTWSQQATLRASNPGAYDEFSRGGMAIEGNIVVIGAPGEASNATGINGNQADNSAPAAGAAYVFERTGTTWTQKAYLKASNTGAGDFFGGHTDHVSYVSDSVVAISGHTIVIGALNEDSSAAGINGDQSDNSAPESGAAYVFTITQPPPRLSIATVPGSIRLSWPLGFPDWRLEQSEALDSQAGWTPIPPPYQSDASSWFFTPPGTSGQQFFRLSKP